MGWDKRLREDREKAKTAYYDIGERLNTLDRQIAELRQEQSRVQGVYLYLGQLLEANAAEKEKPQPKTEGQMP